MSSTTASPSSDAAFADILKRFTSSGVGGELAFADAFFSFIRRRTALLQSTTSVEHIQKMALKHVDVARKERQEQKKTEAVKQTTADKSSATISSSTTTSSSSSSSSSSPAVTHPVAVPTATAVSGDEKTADAEHKDAAAALDGDTDAPTSSKGVAPVNNGAVTSRYSWTQTLGDVSATLPPLPSSTAARNLAVTITPTHLSIINKLTPAAPIIPLTALHAQVTPDDSTWTLESEAGGKVLRVYLKKRNGMEWWSRLLEGDEAIDVTKINPETSSLSDLDGETRQTVEKMMLDQRLKAAGKKTTDEMKKEEALKKFMDMHPEMDFSQAKIM